MNIHPVNHACLLIETGERFVLTDPWPISPAFGGWAQNPRPAHADIEAIKKLDPQKLTVVISHGHDDHFDDYFCKKHLSKSTVVIPKHKNKGLISRASRNFENVIEADENGVTVEGVTFRAFINSDYTNHDAIVTIEDDRSIVIHANDNWHPQEKRHLEIIKGLCEDKTSFYFCQIGIADCFPAKYRLINEKRKIAIATERLETQISSVKANFSYVGADKLFCYANQAKISGSPLNPYEILQTLLANEELITQTNPSGGVDYLTYLVQEQEDIVNTYLKGDLRVRFKIGTPATLPGENEVFYCADPLVWQRIFIGDINLEALGIGGLGTIVVNPETNIRAAHYFLSNYAYRLQNQVR